MVRNILTWSILVVTCTGLWGEIGNDEVKRILLTFPDKSPQELADILLDKVKGKYPEPEKADNTAIIVTKFTLASDVMINVKEIIPDSTTPTASRNTDSSRTHTCSTSISGSSMQRLDTPVLDYSED